MHIIGQKDAQSNDLMSRPFISVNLKDFSKQKKCWNCYQCSKFEDYSSLSNDAQQKFDSNKSQQLKSIGQKIKDSRGGNSRAQTDGKQNKIKNKKISLQRQQKRSKQITNRSYIKNNSSKKTASKKKALKFLTQQHQQIKPSNLGQKQVKQEILTSQNLQLLKINEHLLYEKEYYRQKNILQQVIMRDLQRKLQFAEEKMNNEENKSIIKEYGSHKKISSNSSFYIKSNSQCSRQKISLNLTRSVKNDSQIQTHNERKKHKNTKQEKKINVQHYITENSYSLIPDYNLEQEIQNIEIKPQLEGTVRKPSSSQTSSLLISEKRPLQERKDKKKNMIVIGNEEKKKKIYKSQTDEWKEKMENEFSELLQSVQNENNVGRKMTLRKMLANKAMQLKKIKAKY